MLHVDSFAKGTCIQEVKHALSSLVVEMPPSFNTWKLSISCIIPQVSNKVGGHIPSELASIFLENVGGAFIQVCPCGTI